MPYRDADAERAYQREWARRHYVSHPKPMVPAAERLWSRVDKSGDCWLWTGHLGFGQRYGGIVVDGRKVPVHRLAYELMVGSIPDGLELDHLCRVHRCVRPDHLEPVTHQENVRRGARASRTHCDRGHPEPLIRLGAGRLCRECRREDNRAYRRRQKERAA